MYNAEFLMLEDLTDVYGPPEFMRHRVAEPEEAMEALCVVDRCGKEVSKHPPPGVQVSRFIDSLRWRLAFLVSWVSNGVYMRLIST